ncbi:MAG: tungstate ABC transporter substrate-binding protein WtpA [Candidatus Omnitrophica bacterium]|nr:tungstate ABC transporter substrate-binding protein WtpA [Candidatus Omnitrophota bacterium]
MNFVKTTIIKLSFILAFLIMSTSLDAGDKEKITIFYAANLISVINDLTDEFERLYPDIEIISESSGSVLAIRKVTELNRVADMIFVADYKLIEEMLIPEYTDWGILLFRDPMVLAFTERSRYTNEISSENWYKILMRPEVTYGYANPNLAPAGYRTLMVWQLADLYYKDRTDGKSIYESLRAKCPEDYVRPDIAELIPTLESMALDYLFVYQSTAEQHNLKFIRLPEEINLSNEKFEDLYKKASVKVTGKKGQEQIVCGKPVVFAFSILKDTPNRKAAINFARFLLSKTGQVIMDRNFQPQIVPAPAINRENVPEELREFITP